MRILNLFEFNWWDNLKSENELYFGQNNKKVGKFSFYVKFVYFSNP